MFLTIIINGSSNLSKEFYKISLLKVFWNVSLIFVSRTIMICLITFIIFGYHREIPPLKGFSIFVSPFNYIELSMIFPTILIRIILIPFIFIIILFQFLLHSQPLAISNLFVVLLLKLHFTSHTLSVPHYVPTAKAFDSYRTGLRNCLLRHFVPCKQYYGLNSRTQPITSSFALVVLGSSVQG